MPLRRKAEKKYHHGNLAEDLLDAVEQLAAKFGLEAVSLRACAKLLGVSPAAAFRHYSDKRALLTALATRALIQMGEEMQTAQTSASSAGDDPFHAIGLAYVRFALTHPARFQIMWHRELLDPSDEAYCAASRRLGGYLAGGFGGAIEDDNPRELSPRELLAWSSVHGVASLMVDGPLASGSTQEARLARANEMLKQLDPALI